MDCETVIGLVEAIASQDVEVNEDIRAHLETCPRCASAVAAARRVEALLAARPVVAAPARFSDTVLQAIRRERWRAEQHVDWMFNIAIAMGIAVIVFGIAGLVNLQGLLSFAGSAWTFVAVGGADTVKRVVPALTTYIAAAGLLASTLIVWWWADRRLSL